MILTNNETASTGALRQRLQVLRSADGKSHIVEIRSAHGRTELLPQIAAELVRSKVAVIVAMTNVPAFAARNANGSIPIDVWAAHDAVGTGLARTAAAIGITIPQAILLQATRVVG